MTRAKLSTSLIALLAALVVLAGPGVASADTKTMKIRVVLDGGRVVTGTLEDSAAARDFGALLPISLTMNDLLGREKLGRLPRAISQVGQHSTSYQVGDIALWYPGPDLAIFYRHDGRQISGPGLVMLGRIHAGIADLAGPGAVVVRIESAD